MLAVRTFALVPLLSLSIALVPACKSDTYESGAVTGQTIREAADGIDRGIQSLDATVLSLQDLAEKPAPDLAPQYKAFSKNLDSLEHHANQVRDLATKMETEGKAYFAKWDQQIAAIANEDIRERSQDRRAKVDEAFEEVRKHYAEAREEFKPLMADLKDVRNALGADLTFEGVEAVKKTAGKLKSRAEDVKETLTELSEGFHKLGVSIGKTPAPPPAPTK